MKKLSSTKLVPCAQKVGDHWSRPCGMLQWSWREMPRRNSQIPERRGGPPIRHLIFILATSFLLGNLRPCSFSRQPPWALGLCKAHSQHLSLLSCSWLVKSHLLHTILFRVIHFLTQMEHFACISVIFHLVRFGLLYHSDKHLLSWFHNPTCFLSL